MIYQNMKFPLQGGCIEYYFFLWGGGEDYVFYLQPPSNVSKHRLEFYGNTPDKCRTASSCKALLITRASREQTVSAHLEKISRLRGLH